MSRLPPLALPASNGFWAPPRSALGSTRLCGLSCSAVFSQLRPTAMNTQSGPHTKAEALTALRAEDIVKATGGKQAGVLPWP